MGIGAPGTIARQAIADGLSQAFEPSSRPGKLDTENSKPYRDYDQRRPRRHYHDDAEQDDRCTDDGHGDTACRLVGRMYGFLYHVSSQVPAGNYFSRSALFVL